ncbi:MAG: leucyl aminopeptidase family protein [Phycisphaerales bacterium]|jgi:leucyl aminopeptidase
MFTSISVSRKGDSEAVAFAHFQGEKPDSRTLSLAAGLGLKDALVAAAALPEATGESGSLAESFSHGAKAAAGTRVLLIGLGDKAKFQVGALRNAAASIGRRLVAVKGRSVSLEFDGVIAAAKADAHAAGAAAGEGLGLLGWVCDEFRGKGTPNSKRTPLTLRSSDADFAAGLSRGLALAESTNLTRTLSQTPPNIATTTYMADQAKKLARQVGLKIKIWEGQDLVKEKFQGLINVGKASVYKPCMIRLEYNPPNAKSGKPAVLIGKTMTYDTGGLSLKINNGMVGMKRDKDGGCAVLGAMHAIATVIKPRRRVVALLAVAENSINEEAYRPDDVITYRNGVTVEVTNTDAEGRLVLADALCWACEQENPGYIVDLATLTGGVITALGSTYAGLFCENDALRDKVQAAADIAGERVWRLPMHQEYRDMMKSPVADILNSNPNRKAHAGQGAAFLSYFVEDRVPWCHLDIAGVHVAEKNSGPYIEGPTGWGVRLLANLLDAD